MSSRIINKKEREEGRKKRKKEGRKEERKEGRKEGRKDWVGVSLPFRKFLVHGIWQSIGHVG
jgi:predicted transposase YdaD